MLLIIFLLSIIAYALLRANSLYAKNAKVVSNYLSDPSQKNMAKVFSVANEESILLLLIQDLPSYDQEVIARSRMYAPEAYGDFVKEFAAIIRRTAADGGPSALRERQYKEAIDGLALETLKAVGSTIKTG